MEGCQCGKEGDEVVRTGYPQGEFNHQGLEIFLRSLLAVEADLVM
jgi:hypothetical protein